MLMVAACKQQTGPQKVSRQKTPKTVSPLRKLYAGPPDTWPAPHVDDGVYPEEMGPLPEVTFPEDNPYTRQKAELGKMLFFEPRLSGSGQIACASCHDPELGWADGRRLAFGHNRQQGKRNAMSILNTAFFKDFFWDGRAASLEHQVIFPMQDQREMNMELSAALERLNASEGYRKLFKEVFGAEKIEIGHVQQALATFERTVVSRQSKFDRFAKGDSTALNDRELLGLHLFRTKANCMNCHHGPLFTDGQFHNLGQSTFGRPSEDLGRFHITGDTADVGKFRTPSLRDVTYTGPYFHSGNVAELSEILDMYERGMPQVIPRKYRDHPLYPEKSDLLNSFPLNEKEKKALLAFLKAISTRPHRVSPPDLPQ